MDPISHAQASAVIRTAAPALGPGEATVLREGQVLAGEILRSGNDGSVLIGVGRERVPAQTNLRLDPGTRFLFRVEHAGDGFLLRVLSLGDQADPPLLLALRARMGAQATPGAWLHMLRAQLSALSRGPTGEAALEAQELLKQHTFRPAAGGTGLAQLLHSSGLRMEAALLASLAQGPEALKHILTEDLKAQLLRAASEAQSAPLREALSRAVAGMELEQLLNVARQRAGEPQVFALPVPDGEGWTTATLSIPSRTPEESDAPVRRERSERIELFVRFTNTGPVRAEIRLGERRLAVRVAVADEALAQRLTIDAQRFEDRLGQGRSVHWSVRVLRPEEFEANLRPLDIDFLRQHALMDVSG